MRRVITAAFVVSVFAFAWTAQAGQWKTYTKDTTGLADNVVKAICIDSFGVKWFGTANGLTRKDGATWQSFTTADKLAGNTVNTIAFEVTSYGPEIWVGTDGGVSVISVVPDAITIATPYTTENTGLISNKVQAAAVDTGHVKWFCTDKGVSTFTGRVWTKYTTNELLINNDVLAIASSANGWLYMGTNGSGVGRVVVDGVSSASPYDTAWSGIASDIVTAAHVTADNVTWFGTDKGISRHVGDETKQGWTTWTTAEGLAGNHVYSIAEDAQGAIWAATDGGVSKFDGTAWTSFKVADGLASAVVYAVAVENNGSVWFGTDAGVSQYIPDGVAVEKEESLPTEFAVKGCFPNPFNPSTAIEYTIPRSGMVELTVYSLAGQKIRTLVAESHTPGIHRAVWNGCDDRGMNVSSGVYIATLKMGALMSSGKMLLVK